jgi:hypothetical protein
MTTSNRRQFLKSVAISASAVAAGISETRARDIWVEFLFFQRAYFFSTFLRW